MSKLSIRRTLPWLAALGLACGFAACGSGDSGSDGGGSASASGNGGDASLAAAKDVVSKAQAPPTWNGPNSSPPPAKDKFVISIPCSQAAVGCSRPGNAFIEAAKAMGWRTQLIDPQGDPRKVQAAMRQAITLGADAVFTSGAPLSMFSGLVPKLKKSGITLATMAGKPHKPHDPNGYDVVVYNDFSDDAPSVAAYVATKSGGKAKVLLINDSEFPEVAGGVTAMKESLAKYCSDCEVAATMDFSIVDIATSFPQRVKAELQAHPEIDWVYAPYDFAGTFVATAIKQLGKVGKVKLVGIDGNPQNIQNIESGVQEASFARSTEWVGWAAADQINRMFQGKPTVDDAQGYQSENYARQLIDSSNLPADPASPFDGGIDFRSKYRQLWGVG